VVSNNVVIFPSVLKSLPFDMPGDFTPIAIVAATPMVLVVNPAKVPATNWPRLHRAAQEQARRAELRLRRQRHHPAPGGGAVPGGRGREAKHIPYKGVGPMVTDLIGGQVEFGVAALPSVQAAHQERRPARHRHAHRLQRTPAAPDIPTFVEQGLPATWWTPGSRSSAPRACRPTEVKKAHDAVVAAFADPAVKETMAKQGNTIQISTPEQARRPSAASWPSTRRW
jgi:tripartite-type tricarboxylate transporter receptor subunit TctC